MISVVVDVDDTLINTERRMQGVWRELLGREVPMEAIETLGLAQIFEVRIVRPKDTYQRAEKMILGYITLFGKYWNRAG